MTYLERSERYVTRTPNKTQTKILVFSFTLSNSCPASSILADDKSLFFQLFSDKVFELIEIHKVMNSDEHHPVFFTQVRFVLISSKLTREFLYCILAMKVPIWSCMLCPVILKSQTSTDGSFDVRIESVKFEWPVGFGVSQPLDFAGRGEVSLENFLKDVSAFFLMDIGPSSTTFTFFLTPSR